MSMFRRGQPPRASYDIPASHRVPAAGFIDADNVSLSQASSDDSLSFHADSQGIQGSLFGAAAGSQSGHTQQPGAVHAPQPETVPQPGTVHAPQSNTSNTGYAPQSSTGYAPQSNTGYPPPTGYTPYSASTHDVYTAPQAPAPYARPEASSVPLAQTIGRGTKDPYIFGEDADTPFSSTPAPSEPSELPAYARHGSQRRTSFRTAGSHLDKTSLSPLKEHYLPYYGPYMSFSRLFGFVHQCISFGITSCFYAMYIGIAFCKYLWPGRRKEAHVETDYNYASRLTGERFSTRTGYYARYNGYLCEDLDVDTRDGFQLRIHHISKPNTLDVETSKPPVVLFPGFMVTDTSFVVNEERSLAFWLVDDGYDVYLANFRTTWGMPHHVYENADPRYSASALPQIASFDVPAIVDAVHAHTRRPVACIGHSEGASAIFMALADHVHPEIGDKISLFLALAPAVFTGNTFAKHPWTLVSSFGSWWYGVFGRHTFVPLSAFLHEFLPAWLHGHATKVVNFYLFGLQSHNILERHLPKVWRAWKPLKSEMMRYYMRTIGPNSCVFDEFVTEPWFPPSFPPLGLFIGTHDTLFPGHPLVDRLRRYEPHVDVVKAVEVDRYEHYDFIWGANAHIDIFPIISRLLEGADLDPLPEKASMRAGSTGAM